MMLGKLSTSNKYSYRRQEVTNFCNRIVATKAAKETPILLLDGVSFVHHTHNDITLLATTKSNANAALLMQFLYSLVTLCKSYFNGEFSEEQIRKNFPLIYELLDEVMDFGYPQILDPDLLKMYITQGKQANPNMNVRFLIISHFLLLRILKS
jgi:AP-2 complex subunit mu-1